MKYFFLSVISCLGLTGCKYDHKTSVCDSVFPFVTYENTVQFIIKNKCALSGCHQSAANIGDFTSYVELIPSIENTAFQTFVIDLQIMPPEGNVALTDDEITKLSCWLENGYPEK